MYYSHYKTVGYLYLTSAKLNFFWQNFTGCWLQLRNIHNSTTVLYYNINSHTSGFTKRKTYPNPTLSKSTRKKKLRIFQVVEIYTTARRTTYTPSMLHNNVTFLA
jgi:hypothetical protein